MEQAASGGAAGGSAYVVLAPGTADERAVTIPDRLFVGRECSGVEENRRVIVDDPEVSRHHLEIRLDADGGHAWVLDTSTNGTRLNGVRLERAVAVGLADGDRIRLGTTELVFRTTHAVRPAHAQQRHTVAASSFSLRALVVGDVEGYTTISQDTTGPVLVQAMSLLFGELRTLLRTQRGTLADVPGDAFFAYWDPEPGGVTVADALSFALLAHERVRSLAPELSIRNPDGTPISMGWAVVAGEVAISPLGVSVLGDSTNLAFRLSGLAGRDGRPAILVTRRVRDSVGDGFTFDAGIDVAVKGRSGTETVFGARFASSPT